MKKFPKILLIILSLSLSQSAFSQGDKISLPFLMGSNQILVLGEEYGREESSEFILKTVTDYVNGGGCLTVGLEISSDQQEILDSAMKGQSRISDIVIKEEIDTVSYRQMLGGFSGVIQNGGCLSVYALDTPPSVPVTGDAWMEKEVVRIVGNSPVLIVTKNARAVKEYDSGDGEASKLLAQRLRARTYRVGSILQHWKPGECATRTVELINSKEEKSAIYIKDSIGEIGAKMPEKPSMVTDGVLVWSCKRFEVKEEVEIKPDNVIEEKYQLEAVNKELMERDESKLKEIKSGIKHKYPVLGMTTNEAIQALGDPDSVKKSGLRQDWTYVCESEDGFDYDCFILMFKQGILADFKDQ